MPGATKTVTVTDNGSGTTVTTTVIQNDQITNLRATFEGQFDGRTHDLVGSNSAGHLFEVTNSKTTTFFAGGEISESRNFAGHLKGSDLIFTNHSFVSNDQGTTRTHDSVNTNGQTSVLQTHPVDQHPQVLHSHTDFFI